MDYKIDPAVWLNEVAKAHSPNGARRIAGYSTVGSVGDLCVRSLVVIPHGGRSRVWVIGHFDKPDHRAAVDIDLSELASLVWCVCRCRARANLLRAKAFLRTLWRLP